MGIRGELNGGDPGAHRLDREDHAPAQDLGEVHQVGGHVTAGCVQEVELLEQQLSHRPEDRSGWRSLGREIRRCGLRRPPSTPRGAPGPQGLLPGCEEPQSVEVVELGERKAV